MCVSRERGSLFFVLDSGFSFFVDMLFGRLSVNDIHVFPVFSALLT